MSAELQQLLKNVQAYRFSTPVKILNVCGGHERSISEAGLRSILPDYIQLFPGPGCPVCVCPVETIKLAISLSKDPKIIVTSFGDMLNVPTNSKKSEVQSLSHAKSVGHNVIAVASPQEVMELAKQHNDKTVIFFAAGFETTMAPVAAMLEQCNQTNIQFLIEGKRTWPIVESILSTGPKTIDAIIAPGHVATIMGSEEWRFVSKGFGIASAVSGFNIQSILKSIDSVLNQLSKNEPTLENCYPEVVSKNGNQTAQGLLNKYFEVSQSNWRGIGEINDSGFKFKNEYADLDANNLNLPTTIIETLLTTKAENEKPETPAGCACPDVIMGRTSPSDCVLFDKACTPSSPIGACMVSEEGACNIWWQYSMQKVISL